MKTIVALIIALSMAVVTYAKDSTIHACTADHKMAELIVNFDEETTDKDVKAVADAFVATAKQVSFDVLIDTEGYHLFLSNIPDDAKQHIDSFGGVPVNVGACK
jgi:hypothetical protein